VGNLQFQAIEFGRGSRWTVGKDYVLEFTTSGNLELWNLLCDEPIWQTETTGDRVAMQEDGNLVIYDAVGEPLWASGTFGVQNAVLVADDNGSLEIVSQEGAVVWRAPFTTSDAVELTPPSESLFLDAEGAES
jgi:outer membrane protein assembly factor BamB